MLYKKSSGGVASGLPAGGSVGQVITKTEAGAEWATPEAGGADVVDASETEKGIAMLATEAEVLAGTNATDIVTPDTLQAKIDAALGDIQNALSLLTGGA